MISLIKEEVAILWNALNVDSKGQQKIFALSQLKDASNIIEEVKAKCLEGDTFKEGEMELSTDEKKLIRDCTDREWPAVNGPYVLSLREKLA